MQKRLAEAASGIYSQVAVISRASAVFARDGELISGAEKTVAMNYLKKTEREVAREFRGLEVNDDKYVGSDRAHGPRPRRLPVRALTTARLPCHRARTA